MMLFKVACRNILRNLRRTLMTASAIAVGAVALILFGEYSGFIMVGLETAAVANGGHLTVYKQGYYAFGSGNPAAYSIDDYRGVIRTIETDPVLQPLLTVVTPTVSVYGIAGNFALDASKTFFGTGFVAKDRDKMRRWNEYGIYRFAYEDIGVRDDDETRGQIGIGLARVLGLCAPLKLADCPKPPVRPAAQGPVDADIAALAADEHAANAAPAAAKSGPPRIDLLGGTAGGAPNVVGLTVTKAVNMGYKDLDDAYVGMNLKLAQQLLYGRGEHKALAIQIQLRRTEDMAAARARLNALFAARHYDLEVHDFKELTPQYMQIVGFMGAIFVFISVIIAVIALFTIVNTMSMSVMERTNEIGTMRAMGVRRSGIRRQFLVEGSLIGAIGASIGVAAASILAYWFNHAGITYTPPGQAHPVPLLLLTHGVWGFLLAVWLGLVLMAALASLVPANRAAKMAVVDALRHV